VFVGVHERQLDERGRVALPSAFRRELGDYCYLFLGDDRCVGLMAEDEFHKQAGELIDKVKQGEMSRARQRAWASGASRVAIDKQGRVTLEARLRDHARVDVQNAVQVLGSLDHIEIWNPALFADQEAEGQGEISGDDS
jgi:MraZ protein